MERCMPCASHRSNSPFRFSQNSNFRYSYNPSNSIHVYDDLLYYLGNRNCTNTIFSICQNSKSNIRAKGSSRKTLFIKKTSNCSLYITQRRFFLLITNKYIKQMSCSRKRHLSILTFRSSVCLKQMIYSSQTDHLFTPNAWFLFLKKNYFYYYGYTLCPKRWHPLIKRVMPSSINGVASPKNRWISFYLEANRWAYKKITFQPHPKKIFP